MTEKPTVNPTSGPTTNRAQGADSPAKAIVLLSGGLDSATTLAIARSQGYQCYALSFNYDQRNQAELAAATTIAQQLEAVSHKTVTLGLDQIGGSALTDLTIAVPEHSGDGQVPVTYVPARNTVFLTIAMGWAEVVGAEALFIGACFVDYSGYCDCRPEYYRAMQNLARYATQAGIDGHPVQIRTPLLYLSKAETIRMGMSLGVDYSQTVTCYQANPAGEACGKCDSCTLRKAGFE